MTREEAMEILDKMPLCNECDSSNFPYTCVECGDAFLMAIEALKQPDIVRCMDCKHRPTDPENKGVGQSLVFPDDVCPCQIGDNWYSWMPKDNWFCADGERNS